MEIDPSPTLKPTGRFVLLHHCFPAGADAKRGDHFDLMLEQDDALATWAIATLPAIGQTVSAQRLPDHRKHYLDYEGPVSNDRGTVVRRLSGNYRLLQNENQSLRIDLDAATEKIGIRIESATAVETSLTRVTPAGEPN